MDSSGVGPPSLPSQGEAERASAVVLAGLFGESVIVAGRYELGKKIGAGGLGFVHEAVDRNLGRKVALKFPKGASGNPDIVEDLRREAKVLAPLQHPNIVTVFDVGESEQGVYLAMELIDGVSLRSWLEQESRDWRAVVEVMREAGAGLAAAHEAGVVHRDFKPSNVMVDRTGRVRVVDFGLAREVMASVDASGLDTSADTHKTSAAGTPPYMAPEQFDGEVSAASDQFAFCTALYEGICGKRPWRSRERGIAGDQDREQLGRTLRNAAAPRWLRRVILRGLSREPEDRFPSIGALCAAFANPPRGRIIGLSAAGVLAAATLGIRALVPDPCDIPSSMDAVWTTEARAALVQRLPTGESDLLLRVDEAATAWNTMSAQSCEAREAGDESPFLYELRRRCLARVVDGFEYALDEVGSDENSPERIQAALLRAVDSKKCLDDEQLLLFGGGGAEEGVNLDVVDAIDNAIARSFIQLDLGYPNKHFEILEEIHRTHAVRPDSGYAGARAASQYGTALTGLGEVDEAEAVMRAALLKHAADPRAHPFVAQLRGGLAVTLSSDPERALEALHLAEDAITMYGRDGLSSLQVPALTARARASALLGDVDAAEDSLDQISAIVAKYSDDGWGGQDRNLVELTVVAAEIQSRLGKAAAAERGYVQAIERLRALGTKPAVLARALNNLSEIRSQRDSSTETAELAEEAAALKDSVNDRSGAALSLMTAGTIHLRGGRAENAVDAYERGLAMLPPKAHGVRTETSMNLGLAHQALKRYDAARRALLEARTESNRASLEDSELRFNIEVALLQVAVAQQNDPEARRALETVRRLESAKFSKYTRAEVEIAACELDRLRDPDAAKRAAERAEALLAGVRDPGLREALLACRDGIPEP